MEKALQVRIKLEPHPDSVAPEVFNAAMDGELTQFEAWYREKQQKARGASEGLLSVERGIIRQYVLYLCTKAEN